MEWWNDVRMLCARYLIASDALERTGPVAAAVRAAGCASEEEQEVEEEGSSVKEEQRAAEDDDVHPPGAYCGEFHEAKEDLEPPSYRGHPHGNLELAQPGYLVRFSPLRFQEVNAMTHIFEQSDGKKSRGAEGIRI